MGMGYYQNYFDFNKSNMSDNRMNVLRKDGKNLTQSDYNILEGLSDGSHYIYKDVLSIDNSTIYNISYESSGRYYMPTNVKFDTTTILKKNSQFLLDGTLNIANENEIIV